MQIGSLNPFLSPGSGSRKSKTCPELCRRIRNLKRFAFSALLLALSLPAEAQQPKKVPLIGYLSARDSASESSRAETIRVALRERGYIEGQNIAIEYRYAEGKLDRLPELAAEFVRLKVDAIVIGANIQRITDLALKSLLPSMFNDRAAVDAGGLMYYGADQAEMYRRVHTTWTES
jgi:hypothetical protein